MWDLAIGQPGLGKLIIKLTWKNSQIANLDFAIWQSGLGKLIIMLTWRNSQKAMWTLQFGKVDLKTWQLSQLSKIAK